MKEGQYSNSRRVRLILLFTRPIVALRLTCLLSLLLHVCFEDDVDVVKQGASIEVHNGRTEVFKEYMRLAIDKWGKIVPSSTPVKEVNLSHNVSNVPYERVN